ncbi:MAG TPA: hypothetical protein VLX92_27805, partial [Kofleriaceae bacterium]|nr:hypothetical protein [Kofleriaceae bacterium]
MTKPRDPRSEPDEEGAVDSASLRVDRVYAPQRHRSRESASQLAQELLNASHAAAPTGEMTESEVALRRQLSRLQRQLAEAQRELANKEDEVAAEVEKRLVVAATLSSVLDEQRSDRARIEELLAVQTRTIDVEDRLQQSLEQVEELSHAVEREHEQRAAIQTKHDDVVQSLADARARWAEERATLEARHATELAELEGQKRATLDAADAAHEGALARLGEAHEEHLAQLQEAHERSLATLRGELEPKALEAHKLAEDRERLAAELAAARAEAARDAHARDELHKRELAQLAWTQTNEQAAIGRQHAAELARVAAERDAHAAAVAEAGRAAAQRDQLWENTVAQLREGNRRLSLEAAEARTARERLAGEKAVADEKLAAVTLTA